MQREQSVFDMAEQAMACQAKPLSDNNSGQPFENALLRFVAERPYSWVEGYMEWLEGKEARAEYHALLEEELASLAG